MATLATELVPTPEYADDPAVRTVALTKIYGSGSNIVRALDDVTLDIARGRFTAIMGPSGSGKSTLMHCLAGLDSASDGQILLGDTDLTRAGDQELTRIRRDRIGFVFQAFNLLPQLTAVQNVTLPLELAGRPVDRGDDGITGLPAEAPPLPELLVESPAEGVEEDA